jgi:ribosomal protein S12 methylthiotransferase
MRYVSIVTLGCSKNEIDSELMMGILKAHDFNIANSLEEAEIIIINTCGFIDAAKEESIETIWEMTRYKKEGKCKYIILAGCLAERYYKELMEEIDEVDGIIGTGNIKDIVTLINRLEKGDRNVVYTKNINEDYLEGVQRQNFRITEYVKISEGCNNYCTYCIIPKLRGKYRSRKMEDIVKEVEYLANNGVKEVILIGQNTADYGIDLYGEYKLDALLDRLNQIDKLKWIRILYLYPDHIDEKLIKAIKDNEKVLKYLDIPLQHINNDILKRMNRKTTKEKIVQLINTLRREIPGITIRTTFIVGFPGENEERFTELYEFVRDTRLDRVGVFTYSREEGTPAYNFENQVDEEIKEYRRDKIMQLQSQISYELNKEKIGRTYEVLIEDIEEDGLYVGRTYMDSPDIDGVYYVKSDEKLEIGQFVKAKTIDCLEYDLIGEIIR